MKRILPGLIILTLFTACEMSKEVGKTLWKKAAVLLWSPASITSRLSVKANYSFAQPEFIKETQGIKQEWPTGRYVMYFEYEAPQPLVLKWVESLPSTNHTAPSDSISQKTYLTQLDKSVEEEKFSSVHSAFFWKHQQLLQVEIYECVRFPEKHTLIFDQHSLRVFHKVEYLEN